MGREVHQHYVDPLDLLWISTAAKVGLTVVRGSSSYASTNGRGTLLLSDVAGMDDDDCLAQMILHELCHSLVQGPQSFGWVDWGLDNEGSRDEVLEHACLRLQAALLHPLGLRRVLAPTTDYRQYYDDLPIDPFFEREPTERESITRARAAYSRRSDRPWRGHLESALAATGRILQEVKSLTSWDDSSPILLACLDEVPQNNGFVLPVHANEALTCGSCSWGYLSGSSPKNQRCRRAPSKSRAPSERACLYHEPSFDCLSCGACCREAYDAVEVSRREPASKLHLPLLEERENGYDMKRTGGRCICLRGGIPLRAIEPSIDGGASADGPNVPLPPLEMPGAEPYTCAIYASRPNTCRNFTLHGKNCLQARQRVGLSA